MKSRLMTICVIIPLILAIAAGCRGKTDYSGLSDLGGIYSYNTKINFDVEIAGKLSEGSEANVSNIHRDNYVQYSSDGAYDRLLRWGIARKADGKTPDADPGAPGLIAKYRGLYIGDVTKKEVYLTFDEGYENGYTGKILDVLKDNGVKAVFFITGPYLRDQKELVRRMVDEGHTVGNHTIHHKSLPSLGDSELEEELLGLDRAFYEIFGQHMKYLRPPMGEYSERTLAVTCTLGYRNIFWSFAYDDWYRDRIRGPDYAYDIIMRNLHNGAILLLHAVSKDNADALEMVIKGIREKGYSIGDINDL